MQGGYFGLIRDFGRCFIESRLYMDDEDWVTVRGCFLYIYVCLSV